MKKRGILVFVAILCLCAFVACGSKEDANDILLKAQLQSGCVELTEELMSMSKEECLSSYQYYVAYPDDEQAVIYAKLMEEWIEKRGEIGKKEKITGFEVTKAGKTLTAEVKVQCSKRDALVVFVYNAHNNQLTSINVNMVYTLGETMSKAAMNTLMGIGVVFVILVLISLVISCFRIIPVIQEKLNKPKANVIQVQEREVPSVDNTQLENDPYELIAVIAAAIAADTGMSTDDFVVRSIKRR